METSPAHTHSSETSEARISAEALEARERDMALTEQERSSVASAQGANAKVIHEVVRRHGDEEMERPALSLLLSGLAGGIAICTSILAEAQLELLLPDETWRPLVACLGYSTGFLVVILSHLQLFTESTLSAVIPVATHPEKANVLRLLRFWGLVLGANLVGTLVVALAFHRQWVVSAPLHDAMIELSARLLERDWWQTLRMGIPAGFLIAAIPWSLPKARGQEFWVILLLTYLIALGGFAHVVAGSGEAWLLMLDGRISLAQAVCGLMLPTLLGNVVGGTGLFAALAHGQVRGEIIPENEPERRPTTA